MQHVKNWCLALGLFALFAVGCKENKRSEAEKIVKKWLGKEIIFPEEAKSWYMGKDTLYSSTKNAPYKMLVYTDSVGCTGCKLNLTLWKYYIQEMDSIAPGKVDFAFYFQPKSRKELAHLLRREKLEKIVFLDDKGILKKQNNLSEEMMYQCFLLDADNKVVAIGNPTLNATVWDVYKKLIIEGNE